MLIRLFGYSLLAFACSSSFAHDYSAGELQIAHPWSRALPPNAVTGAAYLDVHNQGKTVDRLLGAQTPRATKTEIHTMLQLGEVMKMQKLDSVGIPAGGDTKLAPGGTHLMLFGLQKPLVAGERFPLTLLFEKAGKVEVEVLIETAEPDPHAGH
ncbi:MAG: copper chaperone PCu(A)C [Pseudomonas sp.]|uniref:copper chaperone PCu(A)C n=1 Tax=Pseudomonas sp. TaxID=306 RepID=UPI0027332621|nr:copper chaperone PCu(A)C [Pseudomonas sp.]MDP3847844.1 copper chaperone PCu(A)C [Pseudomonas sp.]